MNTYKKHIRFRYSITKETILWIVFLHLSTFYLTTSAHAFTINNWCDGNPQRWNNQQATMHISEASFPIGGTYERKIRAMMNAWNDVPGSDFLFHTARYWGGGEHNANNRNEIYWKPFAPNDVAIGRAWTRTQCYWFFGTHNGIQEVDIAMNTNTPWTTMDDHQGPSDNRKVFEHTMLHELGHAFGLDHDDSQLAVMQTSNSGPIPLGNRKTIGPHADDVNGIRQLYRGVNNRGYDLVAAQHRRDQGATNEFNRVFVDTQFGRFPTTRLDKNSGYSIQYTVENLGTAVANVVPVQFYLSEDKHISISDIYLGWTLLHLPAGSAISAETDIWIRDTLPTNPYTNYYIGYIIDPNGWFNDFNRTNNDASHLYQVRVR